LAYFYDHQMLDWLFRMRLYRGVRVNVPPGYIQFDKIVDGQFVHEVHLVLDENAELADWLLLDCDGPWRVKGHRTRQTIVCYLSFARVADAVMFRLMMR
jgi:hypothetical protein